ncbi:MAG TPA: FecR domain-containing protein [Steroidobacter sp.]
MRTPESQQQRERDQAWALLDLVENDPTVEQWLHDLDRAGPVRRRWLSTGRMMALAASVVLAVCIGIVAYFQLQPLRYETQVGEQRDVLLEDGSRVTLNTNTSLKVRYSKARRYIEMERGEALFAVKHDARWPFEVAAGGTVTRALGTEFNVDLRNSTVTVSVLDGAVRVASANETATTITPALAKGQSVAVRSGEQRAMPEKADLRRIDAWRTRRLEFSDTPLAQAVEEFNRYSDTRVVVGTTDLEAVRVSGVFRIGDTDGFLFSLEQALGVQTLEAAGEVTLVRIQP